MPVIVKRTLSVPQKAVYALIGPGGRTVVELRQKSGASISFQENPEPGSQAVAVIQGRADQVQCAVGLIQDHLLSLERIYSPQASEYPEVADIFLTEPQLEAFQQNRAQLPIPSGQGIVFTESQGRLRLESESSQQIDDALDVLLPSLQTLFNSAVSLGRTTAIPPDCVTHLIGRRGDVVRQLRSQHLVFVRFDDGSALVKGRADRVRSAINDIMAIVARRVAQMGSHQQARMKRRDESAEHQITIDLPLFADKYFSTAATDELVHIRQKYHVGVMLQHSPTGARQLAIFGSTPEAVEGARQSVLQELDDFTVAGVVVPSWSTGRVIGKAGEGLKRLMSQVPHVTPFFPSTDASLAESVCVLVGRKASVAQARRALLYRLSSVCEQAGVIGDVVTAPQASQFDTHPICIKPDGTPCTEEEARQLNSSGAHLGLHFVACPSGSLFYELYMNKYVKPYLTSQAANQSMPFVTSFPQSGAASPSADGRGDSLNTDLLVQKLKDAQLSTKPFWRGEDLMSPLATPCLSPVPNVRSPITFESHSGTPLTLPMISLGDLAEQLPSASPSGCMSPTIASFGSSVQPAVVAVAPLEEQAPGDEEYVPKAARRVVSELCGSSLICVPSSLGFSLDSKEARERSKELVEMFKPQHPSVVRRAPSDRCFLLAGVDAASALSDPSVWERVLRVSLKILAELFYPHADATTAAKSLGPLAVSIIPGRALFSTPRELPTEAENPAAVVGLLTARKISTRLLMGAETAAAEAAFSAVGTPTELLAWQTNVAVTLPTSTQVVIGRLRSMAETATPEETKAACEQLVDTDEKKEELRQIVGSAGSPSVVQAVLLKPTRVINGHVMDTDSPVTTEFRYPGVSLVLHTEREHDLIILIRPAHPIPEANQAVADFAQQFAEVPSSKAFTTARTYTVSADEALQYLALPLPVPDSPGDSPAPTSTTELSSVINPIAQEMGEDRMLPINYCGGISLAHESVILNDSAPHAALVRQISSYDYAKRLLARSTELADVQDGVVVSSETHRRSVITFTRPAPGWTPTSGGEAPLLISPNDMGAAASELMSLVADVMSVIS